MGLNVPPTSNSVYLAAAIRVGPLVYTSGGVSPQNGKVGDAISPEEGAEAACDATLRALNAARQEIGTLDRVDRVIKLAGYFNCAEGFYQTSQVMNGRSDLHHDLFGPERGHHLRTALGVHQLPGDAAVEGALIVQVEESEA